jgi:flagellar hook-length control protein FliK
MRVMHTATSPTQEQGTQSVAKASAAKGSGPAAGALSKANTDVLFESALKTAQQKQVPPAAVTAEEIAKPAASKGGKGKKSADAGKTAVKAGAKSTVKTPSQTTSDTTEAVAEEDSAEESTARSEEEAAGAAAEAKLEKVDSAEAEAVKTEPAARVVAQAQTVVAEQLPQAVVRPAAHVRHVTQAAKSKGDESAAAKKGSATVQAADTEPKTPTAPATPVVATTQAQAVPVVEATSAGTKQSDDAGQNSGSAQGQASAPQALATHGKVEAKVKAPANGGSTTGDVTDAEANAAAAGVAVTDDATAAALQAAIVPTAAALGAVVGTTNPLPAGPVSGPALAAVNAATGALTPQAAFAAANHPPIVLGMRGQLLPDGGTMQIRLAPPELGDLQVSVQVSNGSVAASFQTSNDQATRLLSHSLGDLKSALEAAGVTVEKLQVSQTSPSTSRQGADSQSGRQKNSDDQPQPDGQAPARDQQRREMLRRMWRRVGGEPLDLVA